MMMNHSIVDKPIRSSEYTRAWCNSYYSYSLPAGLSIGRYWARTYVKLAERSRFDIELHVYKYG